MNEIAAGLGSVICRAALDSGLAGAIHCYEAAAHQRLGYSAAALFLILGAVAFRRCGRWA